MSPRAPGRVDAARHCPVAAVRRVPTPLPDPRALMQSVEVKRLESLSQYREC